MQTENFKLRYNAMDVSSVEAFQKVEGGYANGCKDVYFIRVLGVNEKVLRELGEMDKALEIMREGSGVIGTGESGDEPVHREEFYGESAVLAGPDGACRFA